MSIHGVGSGDALAPIGSTSEAAAEKAAAPPEAERDGGSARETRDGRGRALDWFRDYSAARSPTTSAALHRA